MKRLVILTVLLVMSVSTVCDAARSRRDQRQRGRSRIVEFKDESEAGTAGETGTADETTTRAERVAPGAGTTQKVKREYEYESARRTYENPKTKPKDVDPTSPDPANQQYFENASNLQYFNEEAAGIPTEGGIEPGSESAEPTAPEGVPDGIPGGVPGGGPAYPGGGFPGGGFPQ